MPRVTVRPHPALCPEGSSFEVRSGSFLCDALLKNGIALEHACEKSCACTTCHVVIREGFETLGDPTDKEEDLLDMAWGLEANSRLSCQVVLGDADLVVEIPKYTINHASEHH